MTEFWVGKYVPGTDIPVNDEALLFSWHVADEIIEKFRQRGFKGQFIVPLTRP